MLAPVSMANELPFATGTWLPQPSIVLAPGGMCPLLETPELGFENVTRASISVGVSRKWVEF